MVIYFMDSCSDSFIQGLHGTDNFWQQLLTKNSNYFGRAILGIFDLIRVVYFFHQPNFLTVIWLPHGQLSATFKGTASLTRS